MEFEDVLVKVGDFGKFQICLLIFFLYPAAILLPFLEEVLLFFLSVPDHWCYIPELDSLNLTMDAKKQRIRPPSDTKCSTYSIDYLLNSTYSNLSRPIVEETLLCSDGWEYDNTDYEVTAASQWNLVCRGNRYISLILSLTYGGKVISAPVFSVIADRLGRKPTFLAMVIIATGASLIAVHMTNLIAFAVFRILNAAALPLFTQLPCVIVMEFVGPTKRSRVNGTMNVVRILGVGLLCLLAWLSRSWITLGRISACLPMLMLLYWKILPESPRWLLLQERYSEAADIMVGVAKINGMKISEDELDGQLKEIGERFKREKAEDIKRASETSPKVLLKSPKLRKHFLIITFCMAALHFSFDGLLINATNLSGNEFLNFFLLVVAEVPGTLFGWWFMELMGRRWCAVVTLLFTGMACVPPIIFPESEVISSILGKLGSAAASMVTYQRCSELFPTVIRNFAMGLISSISGIAFLVIPYIIYLRIYGQYIPFLITAVFHIFAALSAFFLPETLNENLPETVHDAEKIGNEQKLFSFYRRRKPSCYQKRDESIRRNRETEMTKF